MMESIKAAEAETLSAYLEAIRALAMALDARDPYTSGHSERVSALSVAIGRQMKLDEKTLEVLRLGALLHDIGKDRDQRPPASQTGVVDARQVQSDQDPSSRRLAHPAPRPLPRTAPGDRRAAPRTSRRRRLSVSGLKGDGFPLLARIVHVADAYNAITSARASGRRCRRRPD